MARHLQLPADLNLDHPRPLAPQWLSDNHEHSGAAPQSINSALVDNPSGGGGKFGAWGGDDPGSQRQDRWRSEEKPADQRLWTGGDKFHSSQQERFAPQGRARPGHTPEHPNKGGDRWRDDSQSRWGHSISNAEPGPAHWGSPGRGGPADSFVAGDNWKRPQRSNGPPGAPPGRAEASRWTPSGGWGPDDNFTPTRSSNWEGGGGRGSGFGEHGRDAPGAGRGKGFSTFGRGRGLVKESGGASYQRWAPSQAPQPGASPAAAEHHQPVRAEDIIVAKLGSGPQRHKYTVEQMLSLYAGLLERGGLSAPPGLDEDGRLLDQETQHKLLKLLGDVAQQMVEAGFATKAERRLASRLNALLEKSQEMQTPPQENQKAAAVEDEPSEDPQLPEPGPTPFAAAGLQAAASRQAAPPSKELPQQQQQQWYYKDPVGNIQGPYTQQAIEEWHESGFFPPNLPLSTTCDTPHFTTLADMLRIWRAPAEPPEAAAAESLLPQQLSMQGLGTSTAASLRLEAAEAGVPRHSGLLQPQMAQQISQHSIERPGSHPFLEGDRLHALGPHPSEVRLPGLGPLDAQLQHLHASGEHGMLQMHQQPHPRAPQPGSFESQDLLSRLQGHPPNTPAMDPIVSLISAVQMNQGSQGMSMTPIGHGAPPRMPYQPPLGPAGGVLLQQNPGGSGLEELLPQLGIRSNDYNPSGHAYGLLERPSTGQQQFSMPFPGSGPLPDPVFPGSHAVHSTVGKPEYPLPQQQMPALPSFLPSASQHLPQQPPEQQPAAAPALNRADKVVGPSRPPPAAAVGPTSKGAVVSAPDRPLATTEEGTPFQEVQKPKRKEVAPQPLDMSPRPPPPARKASSGPPQPVERLPEWQRQTTLAEAAGLRQPPPAELEAAPAPWASQQSAGAKSLLDIQKEEALQAKARASTEAQQQAAVVQQAPKPASSWGKSIARATPPVTSLKEIQEQERRRASGASAAPPPTAASGPPPSWAGAPPRTSSTMRDRLAASSTPARAVAPRPVQSKAAPPTPAVQETDDDLFWDYGTRATGKPSPTGSKASTERQVNGLGASNGGRTAASSAAPVVTLAPEPMATAEAQQGGLDANLSPEFAAWCRGRLKELRGDDDLTLVQFLMTVASNAEVAEYMTTYLGRTAAVSAFSNEFIKRKLAEQNGKKKSRSARKAAAAAAAQDTAAASGGQSKAAVGVPPISAGGAAGWSKMPKKKKKGQKMDAAMLGFETGTNYAALEKLEG